jgi:hypothetical protein
MVADFVRGVIHKSHSRVLTFTHPAPLRHHIAFEIKLARTFSAILLRISTRFDAVPLGSGQPPPRRAALIGANAKRNDPGAGLVAPGPLERAQLPGAAFTHYPASVRFAGLPSLVRYALPWCRSRESRP